MAGEARREESSLDKSSYDAERSDVVNGSLTIDALIAMHLVGRIAAGMA